MESNQMQIRLEGGTRVDALYGDFTIRTDQSEKSGGGGSAPEPFDLFLASLGTCAGFYVARFCETRDLPLEGIVITQRWSRDESKRVSEVELSISLPEGFPERYRKAVERAVGQCSVKRTLESPPKIVTRVELAGA